MFHTGFYPQAQQQQHQGFNAMHHSMNFLNPSQTFFYRSATPNINQSTQNLNFSRDCDRLRMPHHGFTSIPSSGPHRFFGQQKQRWRQNTFRGQQQQQHHRTPAFHFQDKSTSYFMTEPIRTSDDRITIQLTKVHVGPNGDQQRVFVEQDFSNEMELNTFVQNLRHNFEKAFSNRSTTSNRMESQADDSTSDDSKKSGVVVVEEPDEEPKIYQQHAYNANIESKKAAAAAAASMITPPRTPSMKSSPSPNPTDRNNINSASHSNGAQVNHAHHRRSPNQPRYSSPTTSRLSSSSTTRSYRRRKNKMKYRRQQAEQQQSRRYEHERVVHSSRSSGAFQMPSFPRRHHRATPQPTHASTRFHPADQRFRPHSEMNPLAGAAFQWHVPHSQMNGHRFQHSRSFIRSNHVHHAHRQSDPLFRPTDRGRFTPHHPTRDFHRVSSSPFRFHPSQQGKPTTVTDHLRYPNHEQQLPRVHRTKSECQHSQKSQQRRSQSTTHPFPNFSPIRKVPIVQRHFIPFCSAPMFYPGQARKQLESVQIQLGHLNPFRVGSTRF